jgi:hypothetical protein
VRSFDYVGTTEIRTRSHTETPGVSAHSRDVVLAWLRDNYAREEGWATYVVDLSGTLLLAPRRSEHVACASGRRVLGAGEICFSPDGVVTELTNNSTGYCPSEDSWASVASALRRAELQHPDGFTFVARFRRCPSCRERNLVKYDWFRCVFCDAELPTTWNIEDPP